MTFQIVHIDKIITLRGNTASDKRQWMKILESTIQQAEKQMAAQNSQDMAVGQKSNRRMIGTLEFKVLEAKKLAGSEKIRKVFFCDMKLFAKAHSSHRTQTGSLLCCLTRQRNAPLQDLSVLAS